MSGKMRRDKILDILKRDGFSTVSQLVDVLQYSIATINRDLNEMQNLGLVKRSFSGVELVKKSHLPPLYKRQFYKKREKRRIAEAAAALIENGDTVFLDGSTTVQYMLPFIRSKRNIKVITNSLRVAIELGDSDFEVISLGGKIQERPYVLYGDETVENMMRYTVDKVFFSVDAVTLEGNIRAALYLLYRTAMKNSREVWFLTDKTKIKERFSDILCDFSSLTGVVSDFDFPEETKERYSEVRFISVELA
jgi:DeoR family fructose operon transcriptional repressor